MLLSKNLSNVEFLFSNEIIQLKKFGNAENQTRDGWMGSANATSVLCRPPGPTILSRVNCGQYAHQKNVSLQSLSHPNIRRLIEVYKRGGKLHFILEFCERTVLNEIERNRKGSVSYIAQHSLIKDLLTIKRIIRSGPFR